MDRPDLKDPVFEPKIPAVLTSGEDIYSLLKREDILLYHPYDSFDTVLGFVRQAAHDPSVRAIKQTLYRLGSNSPLVPLLIEARDDDTQVSVLVELKARFDEANNIQWASKMEEAGIHVVYGLLGLKTHCKVFLVVRQEEKGLRCYVHLSTGNYNAATSRIYTDFGLFTADKEITADVVDVFNYLTGYSNQKQFRKLWVAPINLRQKMVQQIEIEIEHARAGRQAHLIFQMNALVDPEMICLLYRASQAGVKIDLIIRGICCLRPGLTGISENIRVYSIIGRFLEHSRVYYFANGGEPKLYMGSADLMQRNLDRRVEIVFPLERPHLLQSVYEKLQILLSDNLQSRRMRPDGSYERLQPPGRKRGVHAQNLFLWGENPPGNNRYRKRP
jgi:polyphosphate kinase